MTPYEASLVNEDELPFNWMDLEQDNTVDAATSLIRGKLFGIVSQDDGGIIAYAIGEDHAEQIVDALTEARRKQ